QHEGRCAHPAAEDVIRPAMFRIRVVAALLEDVQGELQRFCPAAWTSSSVGCLAAWAAGTDGSSTSPTRASAAVTIPTRANARMTRTRSCRPTSNCLPGRVRATSCRVTVSTSMLSTPMTVGASNSNSPSTGSSIARSHSWCKTSLTRLRSALVDTGMSTTARAQSLDRLTTLTICPLGMVNTSPSGERSRVTRNVTFSTVPLASVAETTVRVTRSPKPYCLSTRMKKPDSRSLTNCCAPKPSAAPITVAGAISPPTENCSTSAICSMTQMPMMTTDTQEITDATAWRCLDASERTSASLSAKPRLSCRVTCWATQLTNRAASIAAISTMAIRRPLVMIHSPISPRQKSCQRWVADVIEAARMLVLFVIFSVAPTDSRFQESVDVSIQDGRRIADLVLGPQVLDHLIGVQHVGAHLVAPRTATFAF